MRLRLLVLVLAIAALLVGVGLRVRELDAGSTITQSSSWIGVAPREIVRATRPSGTEVVVEVCSTLLGHADGLRDVRFSLVDLATNRTAVEATVDPQVVRHGARYSCARLASAAPGRGATRLALVARSDTPVREMLAGRILTRRPLGGLDFTLVVGIFGLGLAMLVTFVRARREDDVAAPDSSASALALGTLVVAVVAFVGISRIPVAGTLGGLARGGLLIAAQLALVAFAIPRDSRASFGFVTPLRPALVLGMAPFLALAVRMVALGAESILPAARPSAVARLAVPSAGLVHAETILDPRSGILAIAAIAVLAPVVEELFFRGVLYGSLARAKGTAVAFVVTWLAFVLAHVPQTLGDPSAIVSIATLSLVATALRMRFGSVAAPIAMHLVHNGMLVFVGLFASR